MTASNAELELGLGTLLNEVQNRRIRLKGTIDPSAGAGLAAPTGIDYDQYNVGYTTLLKTWRKTTAPNTGWIDISATGGGGGGGGIEGSWDVTPTTDFAVTQVEAIGGTFTPGSGVFQTSLAGESSFMVGPYPTKAAVLRTSVTLEALTVGTAHRFGVKISEVPGAGQVAIVGAAAAGTSAATIRSEVASYIMGGPVTAPFMMAEVVNFGGISARARTFLQNDSTSATLESELTAAPTAPMPSGIAINDRLLFLVSRLNIGVGEDEVRLSSVLIRDSDSAFNIGEEDSMQENPQIPGTMQVFFCVLSIDLGSGFADLGLMVDFDSAPTSWDITGTTFSNALTQNDFNAHFPAPITGLQVYEQAEFPVGVAVDQMYRIQVTDGFAAAPVAPYGILVSDDQIVVIDNVDSGTESFQVLADKDLAEEVAQQYDQLVVSQIVEASRRAGEMIFYVANPSYIGSSPMSGPAVYSSFDAAYEAAILYPKFVAKILVIDDRGPTTISEPVGGKTYLLAENNIWLACYSAWTTDGSGLSSGINLVMAARCDGLLLDNATVSLDVSSETAGPIIDLNTSLNTPWMSQSNVGIYGVASVVSLTASAAVAAGVGGKIILGDHSRIEVNGSFVPDAMITVEVGRDSHITSSHGGASPLVTVITPIDYALLSVNSNTVVVYKDDDGFSSFTGSAIASGEPFTVYSRYNAAALSAVVGLAGNVFSSFPAAVAAATAKIASTRKPGRATVYVDGAVGGPATPTNLVEDLDGLDLSNLDFKALSGASFSWHLNNSGTPAQAINTGFHGTSFSVADTDGAASAMFSAAGELALSKVYIAEANRSKPVFSCTNGTFVKMDDVSISNSVAVGAFTCTGASIDAAFNNVRIATTGGVAWIETTEPATTINCMTVERPCTADGNTKLGTNVSYAPKKPVLSDAVRMSDARTLEAALVPGTWAALTPAGTWANVSGYQALQYRATAYDMVQVRGSLDSGGSGLLFTLPAGYRPQAKIAKAVFVVATGPADKLGRLTIDTDGTVTLTNFANGDSVFIDNLDFSTS